MSDSYLALTPLVMLLVVALVGFVGCEFQPGVFEELEPPTGLQALRKSHRIDLSWHAPTAGYFAQYFVKRGPASNVYDMTVPVDRMSTAYVDETVNDTDTYFYVVTADDDDHATNEVEVQPLISALTSLIASFTVGTLRNDYTGLVGLGFRVGPSPLVVKTLGRFKVAGNSGIHAVKLVDAATRSDVPGGSVAVNLLSGNAGAFVYWPLTNPVTLLPDTDYYLVTNEGTGGDQWHDANTTVVTSSAVVNEFAVNGDGAGNYTVSPVSGFAYGPVDLQY